MPAINPTQLKIQVSSLREQFDHPRAFIQSLHDLLSFYANRIHRPGESGTPPPAIDAYQVTPPVLRFLEREMVEIMEHKPEEGLTLVDALWKEEWLETRYLASALLRYIHPAYSENILDRVQSWALDCREDELLESLMTRSLSAIRSDDVEMFFSFLEEISTSSHQNAEKMILFSLLPLAKEEEYQDLPTLFSYLKPLLQSENESYLSALCQIMTDLAQRSEGETLFFLRHQIPTGPQPKITRVVRQSLPAFSPSSQEVLKEAIREK